MFLSTVIKYVRKAVESVNLFSILFGCLLVFHHPETLLLGKKDMSFTDQSVQTFSSLLIDWFSVTTKYEAVTPEISIITMLIF
jgi:hypothetical protein